MELKELCMIKKYVPVAGLSIEEAVITAVNMARNENTNVMIVINDIVIRVDKNTSVVYALKEYYSRLYIKHCVENIKRTKSK